MARVPNVLVVAASSPIDSLAALVKTARVRPGGIVYSSGGNGSAAHIVFELLRQKAGFPATHVPYRGTAPSVTDVIAGQVDCTFTGSPALLPHVKSGRLRAIAVSSAHRLPALPGVPTVEEQGVADFDADQWYGLLAPAGTPDATVRRLHSAVNAALAAPEVVRQFALEGAVPDAGPPDALNALLRRELVRWAEVVRAGRIVAD